MKYTRDNVIGVRFRTCEGSIEYEIIGIGRNEPNDDFEVKLKYHWEGQGICTTGGPALEYLNREDNSTMAKWTVTNNKSIESYDIY